jgi:hypothetical protein
MSIHRWKHWANERYVRQYNEGSTLIRMMPDWWSRRQDCWNREWERKKEVNLIRSHCSSGSIDVSCFSFIEMLSLTCYLTVCMPLNWRRKDSIKNNDHVSCRPYRPRHVNRQKNRTCFLLDNQVFIFLFQEVQDMHFCLVVSLMRWMTVPLSIVYQIMAIQRRSLIIDLSIRWWQKRDIEVSGHVISCVQSLVL